jgi:hypothetical protein
MEKPNQIPTAIFGKQPAQLEWITNNGHCLAGARKVCYTSPYFAWPDVIPGAFASESFARHLPRLARARCGHCSGGLLRPREAYDTLEDSFQQHVPPATPTPQATTPHYPTVPEMLQQMRAQQTADDISAIRWLLYDQQFGIK